MNLKRLSPLPTDLALAPTCFKPTLFQQLSLSHLQRELSLLRAVSGSHSRAHLRSFNGSRSRTYLHSPSGSISHLPCSCRRPWPQEQPSWSPCSCWRPWPEEQPPWSSCSCRRPCPVDKTISKPGKFQLKLKLKSKFKWNADGYLGFSSTSLRSGHIDAAELCYPLPAL